MTSKPFIYIYKKRTFDSKHWRYCSPFYEKKSQGRQKMATYSLGFDNVTRKGRAYPILDIRSEKELLGFCKDNFGCGEYRIIASIKGERGVWVFWQGQINEDGWLFDNKSYNKNEIVKLEKELVDADESIKDDLQEEIEFVKDIEKGLSKEKKYGLRGMLRPSGKRGVYHAWEEELDVPVHDEEVFKVKGKKKDITEMSMEEINSF